MTGTESIPQVVVVTGGSAGLGRAIARRFAVDGARVAVIARGEKRLVDTVSELENLGASAIYVVADVANRQAMFDAAEQIEKELGAIDVWVNNAAVSVFASIRDLDEEEIRRVTDVTYLGTVWGTLAALERMRERNSGTIVQVGSAQAYRGMPLHSAYSASKHAVKGFVDSLRAELIYEESAIELKQVNLPGLNTPHFEWIRSKLPRDPRPAAPVFQPEVGAEAVWWITRNQRREITVGLSALKAKWASQIAPSLADFYIAEEKLDEQQGEAIHDPDRPDNLYEPVEGDWAAHGKFDDEAKDSSPQLVANQHRGWLLAALGAFLFGWMLSRGGSDDEWTYDEWAEDEDLDD